MASRQADRPNLGQPTASAVSLSSTAGPCPFSALAGIRCAKHQINLGAYWRHFILRATNEGRADRPVEAKLSRMRLHFIAPLTFLLLLSTASTIWAEPQHLTGHVPAGSVGLTPQGRLPATQQMNLAIGLPLRNREALTNLLNAINTPGSARYHQYLSPAEFAEQFGPSPADYETLAGLLSTNGFRISGRHSNRVLLDVTASVADIERLFHITLLTYQHPTENRTFFAPDREPLVDFSNPQILDVSGLSDFYLPHPLVHPQQLQAQPLAGSGPGGTYMGNDFRAAYATGVAATGVGQVVGLLEFDGYYASDVTSYESQAGLPNVPLNNVLLDSFNGSPGSANIEVALDIDMAIAMAPGLSQVIIYEAGPRGIPNDILSRMVSDNSAKQLSSSWSWSGGANSTTDQLLQQMQAQGQSFFQASGDSDAYTGSINQVSEPCDNPYITVVGGTTLSTTGPGGSWSSEKVWNWYNSGTGTNGSSGGISTTYSIPSWQATVSMANNQGSTTMRNIPDVALTADNVYVVYNNGSSGAVGGTSCAAPLWAGFNACINQQALANGKPLVGFINPAIYSLAQGSSYATAFHDITSGNNTNPASPSKFYAASGYDLCTGWGTPAGSALVNALAGAAAPQIVSNSFTLVLENCTNNAVDPGENVTMNFGLANTGSANTANLVATLLVSGGVTSPSGPQTYGVVVAGGAAVVRPFSFTANGTCGGVLTATLQLQDGTVNLGTVSFTLTLGAQVTGTTFSQNFDGVTAPALPANWNTLNLGGTVASWITTNGVSDSAPNSAFALDAATAAENALVSPVFAVSSGSAQLTFWHNYNLASHTVSHPKSVTYYDGGVLEISIGGAAFADITSVGGSFVSGAYNGTLSTGTGNALAGRQAWVASSGGWVSTTVNLPASAAGQNVQLRWVCSTASPNPYTAVGWFVDSIALQDTFSQCCVPGADLSVSQQLSSPIIVGQNLTYTLHVTNFGPLNASSVTITDTLPSNVSFVSATPGCINLGGSVACLANSLVAGGSTNFSITVSPSAAGQLTNTAIVSSSTADPNVLNNESTSIATAYVPPAISQQPVSQTVVAGANVLFSAATTGSSPLYYQWYFNGGVLAGGTTASLWVSNAQPAQAGGYSVVVTNGAGSATSTVATLTVIVPPSLTQQPVSQSAVEGANVLFSCAATGTAPLNYQWYFGGVPIAGATASSVWVSNVQPAQAGGYDVVVTNTGGSVASSVATLTVVVPPAITQSPASQTVLAGTNVLFSASASGSAPLSYVWYFNGSLLAGATTTTLGLTNVQSTQAGGYVFVASNSAGSATSSVATLTVIVPPSLTQQPVSQTALEGTNVQFSCAATGTAPLSFQWYFGGVSIAGATASSVWVSNIQPAQAGGYDVVVTNIGGSVTSSVATLTVVVPPAITQSPASQTVVVGTNVLFSGSASGSAPLSYAWYFNGSLLTGATATTLGLTNVQSAQAGGYVFVASNSAGSATSTVATLTILIPPTFTQQPVSQSSVQGSNVLFTAAVIGTAPLAYQWFFDQTNPIPYGATNTLSLTNVQPADAGNYTLVVTNLAGSATSAVATLDLVVPPSITDQPLSQTVISGSNVTLQVGASGTAPIAYQWFFANSVLSNAVSSALPLSNIQPAEAGDYFAVVTNAGGAVTSAVATVTVLVPPTFTQQPTNTVVSPGSNALFTVAVVGTAPLAFQWFFQGTNLISGATNDSIIIANAQSADAGNYIVIVTNTAGSSTSSIATLTVGVAPNITTQPSSLVVTQGQDANFALAASGSPDLSYQWLFNGTNVAGATTTTLTLSSPGLSADGLYSAVVTNLYGAVTSSVASLTVLIPPFITVQPTNQHLLAGSSATLVSVGDGTGPLGYQWFFNSTNPIALATTNILGIANIQTGQAGDYTLVVTNAAGAATSAIAQIVVLVSPELSVQAPTGQGMNPSITLTGLWGAGYTLQYKNSLTDSNWTDLLPTLIGNGGILTLTDTNPPAFPSRFYRVHTD